MTGAISRPAWTEALIRNTPDGVSRCDRTPSIAPRISISAGLTRSTKSRPASVSDTLRVVRLNSRTPRFISSRPTVWDSAVVDMPRSSAAARNEPRRAMASTASSPFNPGSVIIPNLSSSDAD